MILSAGSSTLQDLFKDASRQLLSVLIDPAEVGETLREKVLLEAADPSALLRDWINVLLQLAGRQQILFANVGFQEFVAVPGKPSRLKAEVVGELVDPLRHAFRRAPQTLACRLAEVIREPDGWRAELVVE